MNITNESSDPHEEYPFFFDLVDGDLQHTFVVCTGTLGRHDFISMARALEHSDRMRMEISDQEMINLEIDFRKPKCEYNETAVRSALNRSLGTRSYTYPVWARLSTRSFQVSKELAFHILLGAFQAGIAGPILAKDDAVSQGAPPNRVRIEFPWEYMRGYFTLDRLARPWPPPPNQSSQQESQSTV
ncbi:MAG: hypothetical protein Q9196_006663 [Gyalolechia fulgens]